MKATTKADIVIGGVKCLRVEKTRPTRWRGVEVGTDPQSSYLCYWEDRYTLGRAILGICPAGDPLTDPDQPRQIALSVEIRPYGPPIGLSPHPSRYAMAEVVVEFGHPPAMTHPITG